MGVVGRPVEGIDEPRELGIGWARRALFADDRVLWVVPADDPDDLGLGGDVHRRHERCPFVLPVDLQRPAEAFAQHRTAGPGGGGRDREQLGRRGAHACRQREPDKRVAIRPSRGSGSGAPSPKCW